MHLIAQQTVLLHILSPLLLVWCLWRLWKFTITPLLYPERPKELPYWIPILGHGPAFFKSSDALLAKASKYFGTREPFAVTLFGSTMYIVTNPQHTVEVYKNDKTLSFDEFAQELVRTNGYSKAAVQASYADQPKDKAGFPNPLGVSFGAFIRQMNVHQLHPGKNLQVIEKQFLDWYDSNLSLPVIRRACAGHMTPGGDQEVITIPLMYWTSDYATRAGEFAYFGDALSSINPDLASTFLEFDDVSWQVLYRYPAFLSSKMRNARMRMMHAFRDYLRVPQAQRTGSVWLLKAMEDEARAIGIAGDDIAVLYFNIYWLDSISTNTRKIIFWLLAFLLHRAPSLIDPIRAETGPAFRDNTLVDLEHLYHSCPTLDNVWHESLRLCSNAASVRFIRSDTIIGGKHMRRGNRIMIPYRLLHFDERVYGAGPYSFRPERFAAEKGTVKNDPTRGPSWRPFGGGKTLCTGRFIAKRATLMFVALVLRRFDVELVGEPGLPETDLGRPVLGISGVKEGQDLLTRLHSTRRFRNRASYSIPAGVKSSLLLDHSITSKTMPPTLSSGWTQCFPPVPEFTEKDVPDLAGKVYIVTGATSGVGRELARILYSKNAKVYIAARDESDAIKHIKEAEPGSMGTLIFLHLDLGDLRSVKASAERFLAAETKLNVLFNNAGYMAADNKNMDKTVQGHEKQLGVNCLGPFLFTKLLTPTLLATAADKSTWTNEVRVIFVSSFAAEMYHEERVGIDMDNLNYHRPKSAIHRYGLSKVGMWAYGVEFSNRFKESGVLGVPVNPGNLRSDLFSQQSFLFRLQVALMHYPPVKGAYTELFAGLSPEVTPDKAGYVFPFGRFHPICKDLQLAARPETEGGADLTRKFWEWSEEQVKEFV
ncbi:hypothetical protein AAE478_003759 [Parahypoxylon ruwenzoriense]